MTKSKKTRVTDITDFAVDKVKKGGMTNADLVADVAAQFMDNDARLAYIQEKIDLAKGKERQELQSLLRFYGG